MNKDELNLILENHKKWLNREKNGKRADLSKIDLRYMDLSKADLRDAILFETDLQWADLRRADLRGADLRKANLRLADLRRADLRQAILSAANLHRAFLCDADLREAYIYGADLDGANLDNADLAGANLDFSCLPLWCGSLDAQFDDKQLTQIAYHLCKAGLNSRNVSEETKNELRKLINFANQFHRVDECGKIKM